MIKICLTCKKEIVPYKGQSTNGKKYNSRKFCSKECTSKSFDKYNDKYYCSQCGKLIARRIHGKQKESSTKFCDSKCKGKYNGSRIKNRSKPFNEKSSVNLKCLYCGVDYSVIRSRELSSKFCSMSCAAKYRTSKKQKHFAICTKCSKEFTLRKCRIDNADNNFCSVECMGLFYSEEKLFSGENSPTWGGGKIYRGDDWNKQRKACMFRDGYSCADCGISEAEHIEITGNELSVHHIIPFVMFKSHKEANKLDNLITVCESCHRKRHTGDNHPSRFKETYGDFHTL
jgi:hypothetical protein